MRYVMRSEGGWFIELVGGTRIGRVDTSPAGFHAITLDEASPEELGVFESRNAAACALRRRWESEPS